MWHLKNFSPVAMRCYKSCHLVSVTEWLHVMLFCLGPVRSSTWTWNIFTGTSSQPYWPPSDCHGVRRAAAFLSWMPICLFPLQLPAPLPPLLLSSSFSSSFDRHVSVPCVDSVSCVWTVCLSLTLRCDRPRCFLARWSFRLPFLVFHVSLHSGWTFLLWPL